MNFKFLFALFLGCSLFGQVTTIPNNQAIKTLPTVLNNNFSWLVTNMVIKDPNFSITNQNEVGVDLLNGKGDFATNGLTGWTSVDGGNIADWSIVSGRLHHNPSSSQNDTLQAPALVNIIHLDVYKMVGITISQSTGTAWIYLGESCNSDCQQLQTGTTIYYATACCDSGATPIQIWATQDSDISISSFTIQHIMPTFFGGGNTAIGAGALVNTTGDSDYNVAIGLAALQNVTTGLFNIGIGGGAVGKMTTGRYNTGIGLNACTGIITGANNICIGPSSPVGDLSNQLSIDNNFGDPPFIGGDMLARTLTFDATIKANRGGAASNVVCWMSDGKGIGHCTGALSGTPPTCTCGQ